MIQTWIVGVEGEHVDRLSQLIIFSLISLSLGAVYIMKPLTVHFYSDRQFWDATY